MPIRAQEGENSGNRYWPRQPERQATLGAESNILFARGVCGTCSTSRADGASDKRAGAAASYRPD